MRRVRAGVQQSAADARRTGPVLQSGRRMGFAAERAGRTTDQEHDDRRGSRGAGRSTRFARAAGDGASARGEGPRFRGAQTESCSMRCRTADGRRGASSAVDTAFVRHRRLDAVPGAPTFDLIVANHVFEHVTCSLRLLRELAGACRIGGYLHVGAHRGSIRCPTIVTISMRSTGVRTSPPTRGRACRDCSRAPAGSRSRRRPIACRRARDDRHRPGSACWRAASPSGSSRCPRRHVQRARR